MTTIDAHVDTSWKLIFAKQPSKFPFVNKLIETEVLLVDQRNDLVKHSKDFNLPIEISLLIHPTMTEVDSTEDSQTVLKLPTKLSINSSGFLKLQFSISELSSQHNNHDFCLQATVSKKVSFPISCISDHVIEKCTHVVDAISDKFKVVSGKLVITNEEDIPELWYKDQGGRENCIKVLVTLLPFEFDSVPLVASLIYEDGDPVYDPKGSLLNLHSDSLLTITRRRQEAIIKFRIENVSKNHQSKSFCLKIEPSSAQLHPVIAPVISKPITVKSKPNPRKKKRKKQIKPTVSKKMKDEIKTVFEETTINTGLNNIKELPPVNSTNNIHVTGIGTWCTSVKEILCELHDLSTKRNELEYKLWRLVSSYPEVLRSLNVLSGNSEDKPLNVGIQRNSSLDSLTSLSSSHQIFKGLSSEVLLAGGKSVGLMLSGLKSFAERKNDDKGNQVLPEAADSQETTGSSSSLFHQLLKEYNAMK